MLHYESMGLVLVATACIRAVPDELKVDKGLAGKELQWNDLFDTVEDNVPFPGWLVS